MASGIETALSNTNQMPTREPASSPEKEPSPEEKLSPPTTSESEKTSSTPNSQGRSKYRHVAAYHSTVRASSLSPDSETTPSFVGFRNLMVIVLGRIDMDCYGLNGLLIGCSVHEFEIDR